MTEFFVHTLGLCESANVGAGSKIWAFAHVLPNAVIGRNANICDHVFVENDVVLGDDVTVKCGVQLWDGLRVGDSVFIGPNVTFTNDLYPRSKQYPGEFTQTHISNGASIGANATILAGITLGTNCMVGAGAVVTKSVPPNAIVAGNPAKIIGYDSNLVLNETIVEHAKSSTAEEQGPGVEQLGVSGCALYRLPLFRDARGDLMVMEFAEQLPFAPMRMFFVHNVPSSKVRGEHAHLECHQFLVAVSGELSVVIDNSVQRTQVELKSPRTGLYIPPLVWGVQYNFSHDAVLAVFASHPYDDADYMREYEQFASHTRNG